MFFTKIGTLPFLGSQIDWRKNLKKFLHDKIANFRFNAQSQDFQKQRNMHKMDKLARYFPKVENSKSFSRKKLW